MVQTLLLLWQFPQFIVGLFYSFFLKCSKKEKYKNSIILYSRHVKEFGISFGYWIFLSQDKRGQELLMHEYGHSIQSRILGPFYLLIIAIPSIIRYIYYFKIKKTSSASDILSIKKKYFNGFPENWADSLGRNIK